ncbi:MAG TPA: hypothetical protein DCE23_07015 [Firmicutes bacterium]|nr:hypothetical protein [Bacillota bacterium]
MKICYNQNNEKIDKVGDEMLTEELKCIEVLMRTLNSNEPLENQILSVFDSVRTYKKHKNNLFNLISIKNLITYYHENPPFSLKTFLSTGTIPGLYDEKCLTPTIYETKSSDVVAIFNSIVEALSADKYVFDDENNIYVSSSDIEASIPQIWLHRLAQGSKKTTVDKTYFYTKNQPKQIKNKEELIDYLRRTKSFVVHMSSTSPNANYDRDFNSTKDKIESFLKGQKEVKVEHIINLFYRLLSNNYQIDISRHKLADNYWIVSKADSLGPEFYNRPLKEQQRYLDKWIVERVNSSELSNLEAQKLILLADQDVDASIKQNINREEALSGLFSIYINIIAAGNISLDTISLSDFRIKTYLPESKQILRSTRNAYNTAISHKKVTIEELREKANELLSDIARLDLIKDFAEISQKREEYNSLLERYNAEQKSANSLTDKREEIATYENSLQSSSVESIAFDSERLLSLINRATIKGRVYISGKDIVIEDYNPEFAEPTFKVMININKFLELIENINFTLEEYEIDNIPVAEDYEYKKAS